MRVEGGASDVGMARKPPTPGAGHEGHGLARALRRGGALRGADLQSFAAVAGNRAATRAARRASAPGRIPERLQAGIAALSGEDLSDVRVHVGSPEPDRIGAHAFAQRSDIHLAPGQEQHLAHEAWHVVQQRQGRVRARVQARSKAPIHDDPALEREADVMGARAQSQPTDAAPTRPLRRSASAPAPDGGPIQRLKKKTWMGLDTENVDIDTLSAKQCQRLLFALRHNDPVADYIFEKGDEAALTARLKATYDDGTLDKSQDVDESVLEAAKTDLDSIQTRKDDAEVIKKNTPSMASMLNMGKSLGPESDAVKGSAALLDLLAALIGKYKKRPSFAIGEKHQNASDMLLKATLLEHDMMADMVFVFEQSIAETATMRDDLLDLDNTPWYSKSEAKKIHEAMNKGKKADFDMYNKAKKNGPAQLLLGNRLKLVFGKLQVEISNFELAKDVVDMAQQIYGKLAPLDGEDQALTDLLTKYKTPPEDEQSALEFLQAANVDIDSLANFSDAPGPKVISVGGAHPFDVEPDKNESAAAYNLMEKLDLAFTIIQERTFYDVMDRLAKTHDSVAKYLEKFTFYRCAFNDMSYLIVAR